MDSALFTLNGHDYSRSVETLIQTGLAFMGPQLITMLTNYDWNNNDLTGIILRLLTTAALAAALELIKRYFSGPVVQSGTGA